MIRRLYRYLGLEQGEIFHSTHLLEQTAHGLRDALAEKNLGGGGALAAQIIHLKQCSSSNIHTRCERFLASWRVCVCSVCACVGLFDIIGIGCVCEELSVCAELCT